jgi:hypothetical protein
MMFLGGSPVARQIMRVFNKVDLNQNQGSPIPLQNLAYSTTLDTLKKMATNIMINHSPPILRP